MRVLVCGGRDFTDKETLFNVLDAMVRSRGSVSELVHGAAKGADTLAHFWGLSRQVPCIRIYPALWKRDGKSAGPDRNRRMLDEARPDLVVAFPGGAGTQHMVSIAKAASVAVVEVPPATQFL